MLICDYILKLENDHEKKQEKKIKNNRKYIRLKNYAYIATVIIVIQAMLLIIK